MFYYSIHAFQTLFKWGKKSRFSDTGIHPKIGTYRFNHGMMSPEHSDEIENVVHFDQAESALFAQTCLSENLRPLTIVKAFILILIIIQKVTFGFFIVLQYLLGQRFFKANSHSMFSIYVFGAYVENISSELGYALLFLSTCGKHTK